MNKFSQTAFKEINWVVNAFNTITTTNDSNDKWFAYLAGDGFFTGNNVV